MVMLPPASVLVAPFLAVALIWASSPMISCWVVISMSPACPWLLVSVVRLVPVFRVRLFVSMLMAPALPSPVVEAVMATWSLRVRFWVSMLIAPAFPLSVVSTEMLPFPWMLIVSGANTLMLPPLPVELVEAEMKPWLVKLMSRFRLVL